MTSIASFEQTPLLELRTGTGAIYLCPSRLERIRLQWTFRHFHVLPPQLLSRHDQRLIRKLSQSAVVTPPLPVASEAILGVIEQVSPLSTMHADTLELAPEPTLPFEQSSSPFLSWSVLGGLAAVAMVLAAILMTTHPKQPRPPAQIAAAVANAPAVIVPAVPAPVAAAPATPKPRQTAVVRTPEPSIEAATTTPMAAAPMIAPADLRVIAELPPGHFVHPSVPQRNLVGEVQLKALIDPDGSVKQVTVVSGDPRLAEAGMRAVRQWHYSPFAPQATQMEEESQIKMNFFGPDAISIASVASRP